VSLAAHRQSIETVSIGENQNRFGTSRRGATQAPAAISPPTIATAVRPAAMVCGLPVQRPRADQGAGTFSWVGVAMIPNSESGQ